MNDLDFDLIRPYTFAEIQEAIPRIISDDSIYLMMDYLFTEQEKDTVIANMKRAKTIHEFQVALTLPSVKSILAKTTNGISHSGFKNLTDENPNVFLANHRDIVLDSSILGAILTEADFKTPHITWGSNLMVTPLIVDFGKSNQMITVFREGSPKELLQNSQRLSLFIRNSILDMKKPVWIAHSKGRSKNGFDKTDVSILKMLSLSGNSNFKNRFIELNLTPTTISYEWEPCDALKVREIYLSHDNTYVKEEDEDFRSIIQGLIGDKGRVHISIGKPLNEEIMNYDNSGINNNEFVNLIANMVDKQIYHNYKLWPSNYLAYDLLNDSKEFEAEYTYETENIFESRFKKTIEITGINNKKIREIFLMLYANPLINKLKNGS